MRAPLGGHFGFRVGSRSVAGKERNKKRLQEKVVLALIFRYVLGSVFVAQLSKVNRHGVAQREQHGGTQCKRWHLPHCSRPSMAPSLRPNLKRHLETAECLVQNRATSPDSTHKRSKDTFFRLQSKGNLGSPNPFKSRLCFFFCCPAPLLRLPFRCYVSFRVPMAHGSLWYANGPPLQIQPKNFTWIFCSFSSCRAILGSSDPLTSPCQAPLENSDG